MKTSSIFLLFFIYLCITGCKDNAEQRSTTNTEAETVQTETTGWENDIQLNNGSQWLVRKATNEGVQRMKKIIENDSSNSVEEYRNLGDELSEEQNSLDRHTEHASSTKNLEIYLAPLDEKIEQLRKTETVEEGESLKSDLEEHLNKYSSYFIQTGMDITD